MLMLDLPGRLMQGAVRFVGVTSRRVWARPGRIYIELRGLEPRRANRLIELTERGLERHPGVLWARVNAPAQRVIVGVESPPPPQHELIRIVEAAERQAVVPDDDEPGEVCQRLDHPCEGPRTRRAIAGLAADAVGLGISALTRVTPLVPLPTELAGLGAVFQNHPRLRALAGKGMSSQETADSALPMVSALAQGLTGGWEGLLLDGGQRIAQWQEAHEYLRAWEKAEPELVSGPEDAAAELLEQHRPTERHPDPVDRYADRVMNAATAAGLAAVPFFGPRRSLALALTSIPKAPNAGREGFATYLGRILARRGVTVMDRGMLRKLGLVDTVVLDEAALRTGQTELTDLDPIEGVDPQRIVEPAYALFDPGAPHEVAEADGWRLGPLDQLDLGGGADQQAGQQADQQAGQQADQQAGQQADQQAQQADQQAGQQADKLRERGVDDVLGLIRDGQLQAVVGISAQHERGVQAIGAAARRSGVRIVLAGEASTANGSRSQFGFVDDVLPGGDDLASTVRELQTGGAVVLLLSGNRSGLAAADCGIGVHREGEPPAWGAHVLIGQDFEASAMIIDSIGAAARVDQDSVRLAAGGSGVGAVAALQSLGPSAASRGLFSVNVAAAIAFAGGQWRARTLLSRPLTPPVSTTPWHLMPVPAVLDRLDTDESGLDGEEVKRRSKAQGTGQELIGVSLWQAFVEELANPLTPVLAAGAALAAAVGSVSDAGLVAAITSASALVGSVQRVQTDRALADLFRLSAVGARVRREGTERAVAAADLVPGDVVVLRSSDVVPADCRIIEASSLEADESSLTGESLPVAKDVPPVVAAELSERRSMLYEGTTIAAGSAVAVVVATGESTEAGRSMATARQSAPVAGVEARLSKLTKTAMPLAIGAAAAVTGSGLLRAVPPQETLGAAVNLAVASVPEGLPFLVNAAQLGAARRLADHGALVRNPRTIEALGRVNVLCFDKTGTLTEGNLQLACAGDAERIDKVSDLDVRSRAVLGAAVRATPPARNPETLEHQTDRAVVTGARQVGVRRREGAKSWKRLADLPFEPSRGYHATAGSLSGDRVMISVKGAPEIVLPRCEHYRTRDGVREMDEEARNRIKDRIEELAGSGHRVLAVAECVFDHSAGTEEFKLEDLDDDIVDRLVFAGFVALADPVRPSAAPAADQLRAAGVRIVMITGDHPATADAIAATLSSDDNQRVVTGSHLDELDDEALAKELADVDVVARCSPSQKVRIIQAYQRLGRTVAMTGDGANDAPAIRLADVGIALGERGTPAARSAADLVVTDDRLETITAAILEGRAMWVSVREALAILVGGNLGEIGFSVLAALITGRSPMNARQILLVNLLTDLAPALAIALRPPKAEQVDQLLAEGPEASLGAQLDRDILLRAVITTFGASTAWAVARLTGTAQRASTIALAALVGTQLGQTLVTGGLDRRVLAASLGSAAALAAVIQTPGISGFFGCTPLGPVGWGIAASATTTATALNVVLSRILPSAKPSA
jgi:cation-transporting P-type ATPase I